VLRGAVEERWIEPVQFGRERLRGVAIEPAAHRERFGLRVRVAGKGDEE
jgi:hypothetical protein